MALDPEVGDLMKTLVINSARSGQELNGIIDRNLTQGLGTVNTTLIQQHGAVSDDAAVIAALQTASGTPKQGHVGA